MAQSLISHIPFFADFYAQRKECRGRSGETTRVRRVFINSVTAGHTPQKESRAMPNQIWRSDAQSRHEKRDLARCPQLCRPMPRAERERCHAFLLLHHFSLCLEQCQPRPTSDMHGDVTSYHCLDEKRIRLRCESKISDDLRIKTVRARIQSSRTTVSPPVSVVLPLNS